MEAELQCVWTLAGLEIPFVILATGEPVFTARETQRALGRSVARHSKTGKLRFSKTIFDCLPLVARTPQETPIEFDMPQGGRKALGYRATFLVDMAMAHIMAQATGRWNTTGDKNHILERCAALVAATSKRGIEAILYEIAGYTPKNGHHEDAFHRDLGNGAAEMNGSSLATNGRSVPSASDANARIAHLEARLDGLLDAVSGVSRQIQENKEEARSQFKVLCYHQQDLVATQRASLKAPAKRAVRKTDQEKLAEAVHRFHGGKCGLCGANPILDEAGEPLPNIWHLRGFHGRTRKSPKEVLPVCRGCNALLERPEIREASWPEFKTFQENLAQVLGEEADMFPDLQR